MNGATAKQGASAVADALLALNAGSSSFKFALAPVDAPTASYLSGGAERLGSADGVLTVRGAGGPLDTQGVGIADHETALSALFSAIAERLPDIRIRAVGHRIVHGGTEYTDPVRITDKVMNDLAALIPLSPLHQPHGLAGISAASRRFPDAVQVACFDTAFHAGKPWVQEAFALPGRFFEAGVRRYGFHGLACESIRDALLADGYPLAERRVVFAHLGNGCSATAIQDGRSVATSMGFTPLGGLVMGTRTGRIDPGVLLHLLRAGYDAEQLEKLLYRESGLLGLSGLSNDMRDLAASDTPEAARAITYFVMRAVEEISRLAGAMGGLDCVVFSGGIGENAAEIRAAIMDGLAFLRGHDGSGVDNRVQPADEERQLLMAALRVAEGR